MHGRDHAEEVGAVRTGLVLSALFCVGELLGGWWTNSLALMTDAAHMFTDVAALALTWFALWMGSRPASESKTFGYVRAEILAALVNGVVLWVVVFFIALEAWRRVVAPPQVPATGMLALALVGAGVNLFVARRLSAHRHDSLNLRGAYLHVVSDLLGSLGAVAAAIAILATGQMIADALASAAIAALILVASWSLVREAVDVLMEAVPAHVDVEALRTALATVPGASEVHDLHVWTLTTGQYALSAHAVCDGTVDDDGMLAAMAERCARDFRIEHVTIQIEHVNRRATEPAH